MVEVGLAALVAEAVESGLNRSCCICGIPLAGAYLPKKETFLVAIQAPQKGL